MASYSIKDLERLSGIKAHTIRIWEKRYGLIEPQRTSTNIRSYCDEELKKLLNISVLNRHGIKISKIAKLSKDEIREKIHEVVQNNDDAEGKIEGLTLAMVDYDEDRFEKVLAKAIIQLGFEKTVINVLYPFFSRIGVMWQTGTIDVSQEHFISNLIKQKIYVAIDNQLVSKTEKSKTFILFLPEGEWHELGLLFFSYLLKKRNHDVVYLGQSVPLNDLIKVTENKKFDYLVGAIVASTDKVRINEYINTLCNAIGDKTLYLSGYFAQQIEIQNSSITNITSPAEFVDILQSL